jgi:hypothetical protein
MKEMYNSLKEAFIEDPKEFLMGLGMLSLLLFQIMIDFLGQVLQPLN